MSWKAKAIHRQYKIEQLIEEKKALIEINNQLNDKVGVYRNKYEQAVGNLNYRNSVITNTSKTLLANSLITELRATPTNAAWRRIIMQKFH